jgi:hypothetical protein
MHLLSQAVVVITVSELAPDSFSACAASPGWQALLAADSFSAPRQLAVLLQGGASGEAEEALLLRYVTLNVAGSLSAAIRLLRDVFC